MNIVFLSIFICGLNFLSNALPISMIHDQSLIQAPHLLQKLKKSPSQFIDEMSQVDPAELTKIINLLKDELQKSEDKETELIEKVNLAEAALGAASNDAITAEGTLQDAKEAQTSAEDALSDFKVVREQKLAAKNAAQGTHDEEISSLNDEQNVLTNVIQLLEDLIASKAFVQKGRSLLSSNALSVLEMFKKNSTSFISEMSEASPEAVEEIIALLKDLKQTSEARENHLVKELNQAIHELGEASNDVVGAQGALDAAIAAVDAAAQDLAIKKLTQIEKQAIKNSAQGILDDELPGLDAEQSVFTAVIEKLEELK